MVSFDPRVVTFVSAQILAITVVLCVETTDHETSLERGAALDNVLFFLILW